MPQEFIFLLSSKKQAFSELVEQEAQRDEQERNNLFYVALTRARQGLIIFSYAADANPRLESLRSAMQEIGKEDNTSAYADSTCWVCGGTRCWRGCLPLCRRRIRRCPRTRRARREKLSRPLSFAPVCAAACCISSWHFCYAVIPPDKLIKPLPPPTCCRKRRNYCKQNLCRCYCGRRSESRWRLKFIHADRLLRIDLLIFYRRYYLDSGLQKPERLIYRFIRSKWRAILPVLPQSMRINR